MTDWKRALGLCAALASGASISSALAQQLNPQQIEMIRDTAASICNTVKEATGQRSNVEVEGDIKAQLGGLVGKVVDVGGSGKGSLSREKFDGLSRDATAAALEGDRGCRERVFDKMFEAFTSEKPETHGVRDGQYVGTPIATNAGRLRGRRCPQGHLGPVTLEIANNRATLVYNTYTHLIFSGPVTEGGTVKFPGRNDFGTPGMSLNGVISNDQFDGSTSGLACNAKMHLTRSAAPNR